MWRTYLITISCLAAAVFAQSDILAFNKLGYAIINRIPNSLPDTSNTRVMCPRGFEQEKDNCYYLSKRKANWHIADSDCRNRNSTLAVLSDEQIAQQLRTYVMDPHFKRLERWIGVRYNSALSTWVWGTTGEKISYNGFRRRKFKQKLDWKCAVMTPKRGFSWAPRLCHRRRHYICLTVLPGTDNKPSAGSTLQTTDPSTPNRSEETLDLIKQQTIHPPLMHAFKKNFDQNKLDATDPAVSTTQVMDPLTPKPHEETFDLSEQQLYNFPPIYDMKEMLNRTKSDAADPPPLKPNGKMRDSTKPKRRKFSRMKTNEISEQQNTIDRNEIPRSNRRPPRKSHFPNSRNALRKKSRKHPKTRWAPGTKSSDRLRLVKSKNPNEPDQWVPRNDTSIPWNTKIVTEENHENKLTENTSFEQNSHPDFDLFNEEILLKF